MLQLLTTTMPGRVPVLLAPMAGVTDLPFRRQAQKFGAAWVVSEMIASDQLALKRASMLRRQEGAGTIKPLVIQLAGRDPHWMRIGAKLACDAGADVIDINFGCPSKTVKGGSCGSALMREPDLAVRLIEAASEAASVPVTVKMRLGWDDQSLNAPEFARMAEAAGATLFVVHGRTRSQQFRGKADWRAVAAVVDAVRAPVIVNGDIEDLATARQALAASHAAGLMVGRAARGRPWLPAALETALSEGTDVRPPPAHEVLRALLELYEDTLQLYGRELGLRTARKHLAWTIETTSPWTEPQKSALRREICQLGDPEDVRRTLERAFLPMAMAA